MTYIHPHLNDRCPQCLCYRVVVCAHSLVITAARHTAQAFTASSAAKSLRMSLITHSTLKYNAKILLDYHCAHVHT